MQKKLKLFSTTEAIMKTRNGFVSNSSGSSFCIYGLEIEGNLDVNQLKLLKNFFPNLWTKALNDLSTKSYYEEDYQKLLNINKMTPEEITKFQEEIDDDPSIIQELITFFELEFHYNDYGKWIGKSWASIKDDETGKQFKENIENTLKTFLGNEIECQTYEEAWRD
jgi:hypothetical protein